MKFSETSGYREEFDGKTYEVSLSEKEGVWHASISEGKYKIEAKSRSRERALDMLGEKLCSIGTWADNEKLSRENKHSAIFVNNDRKNAIRKGISK